VRVYALASMQRYDAIDELISKPHVMTKDFSAVNDDAGATQQ